MRKSSDIEKVFAEKLKMARELRQITQSDLSAKTGIQASAISGFENGQRAPSLANLYRLAEALKVPVDELLGRPTSGAMPSTRQVLKNLIAAAEELPDRDVETLVVLARHLTKS